MRATTIIVMTCCTLVAACSSMYDIPVKLDTELRISRPSPDVNSAYDDLAPVLLRTAKHTNVLVFTSNRPINGRDVESEKLYSVLLDVTGSVQAGSLARLFPATPTEQREGALSPGGIFAAVHCYRKDGVGDCDLCFLEGLSDGAPGLRARGDGDALRNALGDATLTVAQMPLNSKDWDHHPAFSPSGDTLVFASERFGGTGQSDIWMSTRDGKGAWLAPRLFPGINTSGNEIAPSFSPDGSVLYFSTDDREGYGEFDLWYVTHDGTRWSAPKHMIAPANSAGNDLFYVQVDVDHAYVSSDRPGGDGGYDVYEIWRPVQAPVVKRQPLVLRITARNAYTNEQVPAEITLAEEDGLDLQTAEGKLEQQILPGISYQATAFLRGYMNAVGSYRFPDSSQGLRTGDLYLTPVAEEERTIYAFTVEFDFSLFNIRPEEQKHLDSVVTLLAAYPNSTVVASGHTDSVGTVSYNIKLGYNRATEVSKYVRTYLRERGATLQNDMEIRTYGEAEPVAPNSTDAGRQRNRRVEIAIIRNE